MRAISTFIEKGMFISSRSVAVAEKDLELRDSGAC